MRCLGKLLGVSRWHNFIGGGRRNGGQLMKEPGEQWTQLPPVEVGRSLGKATLTPLPDLTKNNTSLWDERGPGHS